MGRVMGSIKKPEDWETLHPGFGRGMKFTIGLDLSACIKCWEAFPGDLVAGDQFTFKNV